MSGVYKLLSERSQQAVGRQRESKDGSHQPLLCESRSSSCVAAGSLALRSRLQAEQMGLPHRKAGLCYCPRSVQCPGAVACQELSLQLLQSSGTQERKPPLVNKARRSGASPALQSRNAGHQTPKTSPPGATGAPERGDGAYQLEPGMRRRERGQMAPKEKRGQKERGKKQKTPRIKEEKKRRRPLTRARIEDGARSQQGPGLCWVHACPSGQRSRLANEPHSQQSGCLSISRGALGQVSPQPAL